MSVDVSDRFNNVLVGKKLIQERGLQSDCTETGQLAAMITGRKWWEIIKQREPAVVSIVKEFYANAKEAKWSVIQVRGKSVSFDPENINSYYQLEGMVTDNEFTQYYHNYRDFNEVIQCLCRPGAKWRRREEQGAVTFSNKELNRYGKA